MGHLRSRSDPDLAARRGRDGDVWWLHPGCSAVNSAAPFNGLALRRFLGRGSTDDPAWDGLYSGRMPSQRLLFGPAKRRLVRAFPGGPPWELAAAHPYTDHGDDVCDDAVRRRPQLAQPGAIPR